MGWVIYGARWLWVSGFAYFVVWCGFCGLLAFAGLRVCCDLMLCVTDGCYLGGWVIILLTF